MTSAPARPGTRVAATGIGSMPGTDPAEAARTVLGELPLLPHLAELPGRGPHADLVGRSAALLVDLPVDLQPSGWRLVDRPGRDLRQARDLLARDLDALEEAASAAGPAALKVQCAGPWTLAATLSRTRGDRVLGDHGARRDLADSLAEGLRQHLADLARRVPGAELVLQLDEPALPAVLSGGVPTESGFSRLRAVGEQEAQDALARVLAVADRTVVHCCADDVPVALLRRAGAGALSLVPGAASWDDLAEAAEAGTGLWLGLVPSTDAALPGASAAAEPLRALLRTGLLPGRLRDALVMTPACGLAGASPAHARAALKACRELVTWCEEELA